MTSAPELDDGQTLRVVPMFVDGPGTITVAYACLGSTCSFVSERVDVDDQSALQATRRHLAGEHADVVGFGLCAKCGEITDHFRAVVPELVDGVEISDTWLCENDAPPLPVVVDQAGAGAEPNFDPEHPFDTLVPGSLKLTAIEGIER